MSVKIALAGNPNCGKTTLFNALTGSNQFVGNWPGVTDAIINIVDGTNIERNLYLSTQIMELGIPVVMAVNMMDLVEKAGDKIHTDKLSKLLGCEVVEISALKGTGIQKAAAAYRRRHGHLHRSHVGAVRSTASGGVGQV